MGAESHMENIPELLESQIVREAGIHRRSVEQETIMLLEEALLARATVADRHDADINAILRRYEALPSIDPRPLSELIEYDALGLPK